MKELSALLVLLFVTISVSAQTGVETDSIDTSAFDKYLDEIVIVAKKPGTVVKADRKVYTVNQDLTSKASSASEILNHIPSIEVDIDGNVSMRGNDNVTILVNGKPSAMMAGRTRADALSQLSAANIERIEVIEDRYETRFQRLDTCKCRESGTIQRRCELKLRYPKSEFLRRIYL